jgi:short-subunit dehydrogenase
MTGHCRIATQHTFCITFNNIVKSASDSGEHLPIRIKTSKMSNTPQTPVWFITGASAGFGKYIALDALSRGHKIIASARSTSNLTDLASAGADTIALDVASPQPQIEAVAKEANAKYGYITHLVNAAGYMLLGAVEETSPEEDLKNFSTNVLGTLNVCKAFLPYLRSSSSPNRSISNFGSIASWYSGAGYALYSGTKFAVSGISEGLRAELAPFGIAVTVIEPGYFRTSFLNPGKTVRSEKVLDVYADSAVGQSVKEVMQYDGNQPGDVEKGSRVIVDILTKSGPAQGREVPIRIMLGSDAPAAIGGVCKSTLALLDEWSAITTQTDHE